MPDTQGQPPSPQTLKALREQGLISQEEFERETGRVTPGSQTAGERKRAAAGKPTLLWLIIGFVLAACGFLAGYFIIAPEF